MFKYSNEVPYDEITYIISKIIYDGRVTDFWDNRIL